MESDRQPYIVLTGTDEQKALGLALKGCSRGQEESSTPGKETL